MQSAGGASAPFHRRDSPQQVELGKGPAALRPELEEVVERMAGEISIDSAKLETDAIASLDGIKISPEPAGAAAKWEEFIAQRRNGLIAKIFSTDILDAMDAALARARRTE